MRRSPGWVWGSRFASILVLAGLIVYLCLVGLDKADELASILSLLVAVVALIMPYFLPPTDGATRSRRSTQSVINTVVDGNLIQILGTSGARVPEPATPRAPLAPSHSAEGGSAQLVSGARVGKSLIQADLSDGEIAEG
jgi:hypothetical protein